MYHTENLPLVLILKKMFSKTLPFYDIQNEIFSSTSDEVNQFVAFGMCGICP